MRTSTRRRNRLAAFKIGRLKIGNKQYGVYFGKKHPPGYVRLNPPAYLRTRDPSLKEPIWIREDEATDATEGILPNIWVVCEKELH